MVKLISSELKKLEATKVNWLLDGFPRTRNQAVALQGQAPVDAVVYLDVPFQTIIDRVKGALNLDYLTSLNQPLLTIIELHHCTYRSW